MSNVVTPASPARRAASAAFIDAVRKVARSAGAAGDDRRARGRGSAHPRRRCAARRRLAARRRSCRRWRRTKSAVARIVAGMLGAAADRGERRARVVAAAGDDVEAVRRRVVAGGAEVLARLDEQAERKAARPGARRSGRRAAEREVGAAGQRRRERQADHRGEVARPHRPVAVGARGVGVRGNVGVAGDDLRRVEEAGGRRCCRCRRGCRRRRRRCRTGRRWRARSRARRRRGLRPAAAGECEMWVMKGPRESGWRISQGSTRPRAPQRDGPPCR